MKRKSFILSILSVFAVLPLFGKITIRKEKVASFKNEQLYKDALIQNFKSWNLGMDVWTKDRLTAFFKIDTERETTEMRVFHHYTQLSYALWKNLILTEEQQYNQFKHFYNTSFSPNIKITAIH